MCLGVFHLGFILFGTLWVSWIWVAISFPILGKFSTLISSGIFSWPFFLSSSSGTPVILMLGCLTLSQMFLRLSSFPFSSLLLYFHHSIFHLTYTIFCLRRQDILLYLIDIYLIYIQLSIDTYLILMLVPSRVLLISVIALFIIDRLFFISSRSLLNISCIFSILVSLYLLNPCLFLVSSQSLSIYL